MEHIITWNGAIRKIVDDWLDINNTSVEAREEIYDMVSANVDDLVYKCIISVKTNKGVKQ